MASLDFCPVVLQLAWLFSSPACSVCVQLLAACKPRASREIQPRVPASLHSLEHFFTLSHTLPLHNSHLNTGFLSAVLQVNLSWNKANTWLIKFNLTDLKSLQWYDNREGKSREIWKIKYIKLWMNQSYCSLVFISQNSFWKLFTFREYRGIYSKVWEGMWKVIFLQNRVHWQVIRDWDKSRVPVAS